MTWFYNTFDSWADGAQITRPGTSADGVQVSDIVLNNASIGNVGNANFTASAAQALQGNRAAVITLAAAASYIRYDDPVGGPRGVIRRPWKHVNAPNSETVIAV